MVLPAAPVTLQAKPYEHPRNGQQSCLGAAACQIFLLIFTVENKFPNYPNECNVNLKIGTLKMRDVRMVVIGVGVTLFVAVAGLPAEEEQDKKRPIEWNWHTLAGIIAAMTVGNCQAAHDTPIPSPSIRN